VRPTKRVCGSLKAAQPHDGIEASKLLQFEGRFYVDISYNDLRIILISTRKSER